MNYLWEILLQAKEQRIDMDSIRFKAARTYSPYMELSEECLNVVCLEEPYEIEINPHYRFHNIFKEMFHPDVMEYPALRDGLFQLLMHQIGDNDIRMGMTKEEYYKKLLGAALTAKVYGEEAACAFALFKGEEKEVLLEGMLSLYRVGDSLELFRHVITALVPNCIVYNSNDNPYEILLYVGKKRQEELESKVQFILNQFVNIRYRVELYYEYHFGIIGIDETMYVDEIAIC